MSLFERLKSAVKGNAVLKEYEIGQQIASAGPGLQWRVYQGVRKTTRKASSVVRYMYIDGTRATLPAVPPQIIILGDIRHSCTFCTYMQVNWVELNGNPGIMLRVPYGTVLHDV